MTENVSTRWTFFDLEDLIGLCNRAKCRWRTAAAHQMQPALCVIGEQPRRDSPFDPEKLQLVREFLQREFRGWYHRDYFEFHTTNQIFVIETEAGRRHLLVIPERTFEDGGFTRLLNQELVIALEQAAPGARIRLTSRGPLA